MKHILIIYRVVKYEKWTLGDRALATTLVFFTGIRMLNPIEGYSGNTVLL